MARSHRRDNTGLTPRRPKKTRSSQHLCPDIKAGSHEQMRIAQIAPLTESVPPRTYGGTERVVSYLTEELMAMGHDVTLFASGDSVTAAKLEAVWPVALRFDKTLRDAMAPQMLLIEKVYQKADDFDVLHCHLACWTFALLSRQDTPYMTTLHGRLALPELTRIYDCFE